MERFKELERISPGISSLKESDHIAIQKFTIVWSLFEATFLETQASSKSIYLKIMKLEDDYFEKDWFKDELQYFKNRYFQDDNFTCYFDGLNLRKNDNVELVKRVVSNQESTAKEQLIACLTIIYRYRNNLFHGIKWSYGVKNQQKNFNQSVSLLVKCFDRFIS